MTNRIVGGWGLNSCGLDATIPFSTVARRWQRLASCWDLFHATKRGMPLVHLHAIDSPTVSVALDKVTSRPSLVTLLIHLVIDQPLKTKRPDWAFQWRPRLSSPSRQSSARWGYQQQACQIPCSFERRLLAGLAIFPMDHTMVASR